MSKTWQLSSYVSKCPGSVRWKCKCYQNVQTWTWVFFINISYTYFVINGKTFSRSKNSQEGKNKKKTLFPGLLL